MSWALYLQIGDFVGLDRSNERGAEITGCGVFGC